MWTGRVPRNVEASSISRAVNTRLLTVTHKLSVALYACSVKFKGQGGHCTHAPANAPVKAEAFSESAKSRDLQARYRPRILSRSAFQHDQAINQSLRKDSSSSVPRICLRLDTCSMTSSMQASMQALDERAFAMTSSASAVTAESAVIVKAWFSDVASLQLYCSGDCYTDHRTQ